MKKYKHWILVFIGSIAALTGLYMINVVDPIGLMKTVPYFLVGIGCGTLGHSVGSIYQAYIYKKNPDIAKNMEIETKDERNIMIKNQAMAKGYQMMTYAFGILLLVFGIMDVPFEIFIAFAIVYIFVQIYTVYCHVRMTKDL